MHSGVPTDMLVIIDIRMVKNVTRKDYLHVLKKQAGYIIWFCKNEIKVLVL